MFIQLTGKTIVNTDRIEYVYRANATLEKPYSIVFAGFVLHCSEADYKILARLLAADHNA